ncbi:flocculation protein FLO11 [Nilaparvata lugens]|uniref:flocculation protein FLO11 n=1 Tax=Nilaparvata lugens TaxID=108931 RepID=UPI00193E3704|nr:flocculation protein FLO11 [Nilaparvata lugens]
MINAESGESILQESGNLMENPSPSSSFQENFVLKVGDTLNASLLTLQENSGELSQVSGSNNRKREVNILEDSSADGECEIIDSDISELDGTRLEDPKVSEEFDKNQSVSLQESQNSANDLLSSNDGALDQKSVSDENLDSDSKPTNKHKRNEVHRFKKKMKGLIKKTLENVFPLKMDDSFSEQSQPIPSIDNGGGILLKDLDFKNDEKIPDTNEKNNSKSSSSVNDYRNKDKNLVSNNEDPKSPLLDYLKDSVETEVDVSSSNNVNEAKLIQDPSGESIMESIDGVKTLKLSSVNFKADDSESNFVSDQSSMDKKLVKKQKSHNAVSRHPMRLSHKNRHKKVNSAKGKIVSSYNRNGLLKTTSPSSVLDSEGNSGGLFSSKLFIHGKKSPSKNKPPFNTSKKGLKGKEDKLEGFYPYETTTKTMKVHNMKKNDNKNKSSIAGKKMVKVKLSVSPCQFNKDKYLIKNKSASKANAPKILSSRSVKQDVKHVNKNATESSNKLNTTTSKMTSENKFDVTTQKLIKQEKETNPSKEKKSGNALENANFFDKTTLLSTESSNNGQKENSKKTSETKDGQSNTSSTTLTSVPQKEIKDASIPSSRKSGPALSKHPTSGHLTGKKQDSASLKEDRCEGDDDDNDDDEYADTCEKSTKTVCKSQTPKECSTTETPCKSTESNDDDDVCDPLEDDGKGNNEPEGPCEPEEDEIDTKKSPCGTTEKVCETTEDSCKSTEEPCGTTAPPCETTKAPCDTTEPPCETSEDPCKTTEAPCDTTEAPCETTVDPCKTTEEPCETTVNPCKITEEPCDTTETTVDPCKASEEPSETTVPPCEEPTEAPCETTEAPCTTPAAPDPCTTPCSSNTESADEEMETDPPCQTTPLCKTASKKGNSTSEVDKGYVDRNEDQDDDDDDNEYDYENE